MIAQDLVHGALKLLRVLAQDLAPTAEEEADGLAALNDLLDLWALDPLKLYRVVRERALASGGDGPLLIRRPIKVVRLTAEMAPGWDRPVRLVQFDEYADLSLKGLTVNAPEIAYVDYNYPFAEIYLYPRPSGLAFTVWSQKPLARFAALTDPVHLPPGYALALKFNLAVTLAPLFQVAASPDVRQQAALSLQALKRNNVRVPQLELDTLSGPGRYNVRTDS